MKTRLFRDQIMAELIAAATPNKSTKDILVVVRDQLSFVRACIESVVENTENYRLHIWDNASHAETHDYLAELAQRGIVHRIVLSEENLGFIVPNNRLAEHTTGDHIILLNSDCEVKKGWDHAMLNHLDSDQQCAVVGYCGSKLDREGKGGEAAFGRDADFICGWCLCVRRADYDRYGLFNERDLEFAYGEDSDLSLRVREAGRTIYSLHADLVIHHGNKTITQVHRELGDYLKGTFERNHEYIRRRWSEYIKA